MTISWKQNSAKYQLKRAQVLHLVCQGTGAGHPLLPRLEIGIKNQIFLEKPEVGILIPINLFESYDSFLQIWSTLR